MKPALLAVAVALALAPAAHAGGPEMLVGAAEDSVRQPTLPGAKAQMVLLRLMGLDAVRVTSVWTPGAAAPSPAETDVVANVDEAARLAGMRVVVQVLNAGSRTTPLTPQDRHDFASYAAALARRFPTFGDFVVGNEPNLNRYWLPQFGANGEDVAAQAYEQLLAETYDALKHVSADVTVWGLGLSPRGEDKPNSTRPTHSPTQFLLDLGTTYRASGRTAPIMDGLAIHPYEDNSSLPPSFQHPKTTTIAVADYDKLVQILAQAFDGTAQTGSTLPVLYDEFGVESQIPAAKASLYTGTEPATTHPVDETTQAAYYHDALALAFCQANVRGFFFFHSVDERALDRWQSGLFYADGTPKSGLPAARAAARASLGGTIARCPGLQLTPVPDLTVPQTGPRQKAIPPVTLRCNLDCTYRVRLEKLATHRTVGELYGHAPVQTPVKLRFRQRRLAPALYRFTASVRAPVNTGPPGTANSRAFRLG